MMAAHTKTFLFLFFLLIGGTLKANENSSETYVTYANDVIRSFAKVMKTEFGLQCCGSGGKMPHDIEEFKVGFEINRRATIEEARMFEVQATERFLKIINENEKIRPFLREFPFKANRVAVSISFNKKDNNPYTDGSVSYMSLIKGKIYYSAQEPKNEKLYDIFEEPYEEALKIVENSSGNSPSAPPSDTL